jgi:hypothetical protein
MDDPCRNCGLFHVCADPCLNAAPGPTVAVPVDVIRSCIQAAKAAAFWYGAGRGLNEPGAGPNAAAMVRLRAGLETLLLTL